MQIMYLPLSSATVLPFDCFHCQDLWLWAFLIIPTLWMKACDM